MNAQEQDTRTDGHGETKKPRRRKGDGCIFTRPDSPFLQIKYSRRGKPYVESTGLEPSPANRNKAEKMLSRRKAEILTSTFTEPKYERVRLQELFDDVERDYRIKGRTSLDDLQSRWRNHLKPVFAHLRAVDCGTDNFTRYCDARQQDGASIGLINRELAILKRMYRLGQQCTPRKVLHAPHIEMFRETNRRKGFLRIQQHDRLAAECGKIGLWMEAIFETGYTYGWRHETVLELQVGRIDLLRGMMRLDPLTTKNDEGLEVPLSRRLQQLLPSLVAGKGPEDLVFTRGRKPVKDFRDSWNNACERAGVAGLYFHDLRRTAAKNMRKAGVPESLIMRICQWKTASVFRRYAITDNSDLQQAMQQLEANQEREKLAVQVENKSRIGRVDAFEAVEAVAEVIN